MKVFIGLGDEGGSGYYRCIEPARVARLHGIEVEVSADFNVDAERLPDGSYRVDELRIDADVIVLQRPLPQVHYAVAVAAKRQGMAVIADIDDDFHNVHKRNVAAQTLQPRLSPLENRRWLEKTLKLCDVITVSTPALLRYAQGRTQGVVVRNCLPEKILTLPRRPLCGQIGWTGTVSTHPEDLQAARGVLDYLPTPIAIVGDPVGVQEALQIRREQVHFAASWQKKVPVYWRMLNMSMDVGICPLETSDFNRAKSYLKPLEYMALGKPFIASPLPEYRRLVQESGAGVLAEGPKQWATAAKMLLTNGDEYRVAGAEWAKEHTLEKQIHHWIGAWELAMEVAGK